MTLARIALGESASAFCSQPLYTSRQSRQLTSGLR
jgi:hypothetical protein